jgi:hypothetical protein
MLGVDDEGVDRLVARQVAEQATGVRGDLRPRLRRPLVDASARRLGCEDAFRTRLDRDDGCGCHILGTRHPEAVVERLSDSGQQPRRSLHGGLHRSGDDLDHAHTVSGQLQAQRLGDLRQRRLRAGVLPEGRPREHLPQRGHIDNGAMSACAHTRDEGTGERER